MVSLPMHISRRTNLNIHIPLNIFFLKYIGELHIFVLRENESVFTTRVRATHSYCNGGYYMIVATIGIVVCLHIPLNIKIYHIYFRERKKKARMLVKWEKTKPITAVGA